MAIVNYPECTIANIIPEKALRLAARMERIGRDAQKLGVVIFCGCGNDIRFYQKGNDRALILASFIGPFNGGAGDTFKGDDGLLRGE